MKQDCVDFLLVETILVVFMLPPVFSLPAKADTSFQSDEKFNSSIQLSAEKSEQVLPKEFINFLLTIALASLSVGFARYVIHLHLNNKG